MAELKGYPHPTPNATPLPLQIASLKGTMVCFRLWDRLEGLLNRSYHLKLTSTISVRKSYRQNDDSTPKHITTHSLCFFLLTDNIHFYQNKTAPSFFASCKTIKSRAWRSSYVCPRFLAPSHFSGSAKPGDYLLVWGLKTQRSPVKRIREEIARKNQFFFLGGGNSNMFIFTPTWEDDPIWLIFFKWFETTN